jgi:precorrin-8X/cobalt-precorrin-8 methylmutase
MAQSETSQHGIDHQGIDHHGIDHPIFRESVRRIRAWLEPTGIYQGLSPLEQELLERLVHSSGDLEVAPLVAWSPQACALGAAAVAQGAVILTDTAMAAAAVAPMARRTFANPVHTLLEWAPTSVPEGAPSSETRSSMGMAAALKVLGGESLGGPPQGARPLVVLIGSAPTALETLLDLVAAGSCPAPALVIGMPVGFVGVAESKRHLAESGLVHLRLEGPKGGAGLVAAACNALLRRAWLEAC